MPINLFAPDVDQSTVDNLCSGTLIPDKRIPHLIGVTPGTLVRRGTTLKTDDGISYEPSIEDIACILFRDVESADPVEYNGVAVYTIGEFNQNVIEEVMGAPIDPLELEKARSRLIYIAPMYPAPEPF